MVIVFVTFTVQSQYLLPHCWWSCVWIWNKSSNSIQ